jgi:hypothetical protein
MSILYMMDVEFRWYSIERTGVLEDIRSRADKQLVAASLAVIVFNSSLFT